MISEDIEVVELYGHSLSAEMIREIYWIVTNLEMKRQKRMLVAKVPMVFDIDQIPLEWFN